MLWNRLTCAMVRFIHAGVRFLTFSNLAQFFRIHFHWRSLLMKFTKDAENNQKLNWQSFNFSSSTTHIPISETWRNICSSNAFSYRFDDYKLSSCLSEIMCLKTGVLLHLTSKRMMTIDILIIRELEVSFFSAHKW